MDICGARDRLFISQRGISLCICTMLLRWVTEGAKRDAPTESVGSFFFSHAPVPGASSFFNGKSVSALEPGLTRSLRLTTIGMVETSRRALPGSKNVGTFSTTQPMGRKGIVVVRDGAGATRVTRGQCGQPHNLQPINFQPDNLSDQWLASHAITIIFRIR